MFLSTRKSVFPVCCRIAWTVERLFSWNFQFAESHIHQHLAHWIPSAEFESLSMMMRRGRTIFYSVLGESSTSRNLGGKKYLQQLSESYLIFLGILSTMFYLNWKMGLAVVLTIIFCWAILYCVLILTFFHVRKR